MEVIRKSIGLMLTSYEADASFRDILLQICRVGAVYFCFAVAGMTAVFLSYVLAGWFHGIFLTFLILLSCVTLFIVVGMLLLYFEPELKKRFLPSKANKGTLFEPKAKGHGGGL